MSTVEPGIGAAYQANLLDNGNPIELPDGSSWAWSTDDPTDKIVQGGGDGSTAKITVADPPAEGRTQITVTATTTDPKGESQSGSVTDDIVPGIEHTYTVAVNRMFAGPKK